MLAFPGGVGGEAPLLLRIATSEGALRCIAQIAGS